MSKSAATESLKRSGVDEVTLPRDENGKRRIRGESKSNYLKDLDVRNHLKHTRLT